MRKIILLVLALVLLAYISLGGLMFSLIESGDEDRMRSMTAARILNFIHRNPCVNRDDLSQFVKIIIDAKTNGASMGDNATVVFNNWGYMSATFFATTVVTTIGYGSIVPITDGGRAACIIYALIGIPLCLIVLSGIGEMMTNFMKRIFSHFGCDTKKTKIICFIGYVFAGVVFFMLIPSAVWAPTQNWNYFDSFYYSFISLSTIGFGDFVLSNHPKLLVMRFFTSFWLLFGLSWLSSILSMISEMMLETTEEVIEDDVPVSSHEQPHKEIN